ncbi:hypothetical protein [Pedosphaera parvula]|nr:hypothetical protein [Pedosphaera parvula]
MSIKVTSAENSKNSFKDPAVILSLLVVGILYANLSVIFNSSIQSFRIPIFPLPESAQDPFQIFGVFSYYETNNSQLTIWGQATNPETGEFYWKQLPSDDYFPFARGDQNSRMWANRQYRLPDHQKHNDAWQFMGRRIKDRYNQLHPKDCLAKVGLQSLTWPRSADGFYAQQTAKGAERHFWIIAE